MGRITEAERKRLIEEHPLIGELIALNEVFWENSGRTATETALRRCPYSLETVEDAAARLRRFAPLLAEAFPETKESQGIIESELRALPRYQAEMSSRFPIVRPGRFFVKLDSHLPIAGSIKARGGIYEVLAHAERLALQTGAFSPSDDYTALLGEPFRTLFSSLDLVAASTGNLGLSIGIMAARLGFRTSIHMSSDARAWKKRLLRDRGVTVIEHDGDFSAAVDAGRASVGAGGHFVDDENSLDLFLGYAVAALRLKTQLEKAGVGVDEAHPLFIYLPCGVGGGPGGVTFGLKLLFGDDVHCFFAEPTHAPAMLLGQISGRHDAIAVQDIGIDNKTEADGLAVGRPSRFVGKLIEPFLDGCYTLQDSVLFERLKTLADSEGIFLEPSALAGFYGPEVLSSSPASSYLSRFSDEQLAQATHIAWATGGGMVPGEVMDGYYAKAE